MPSHTPDALRADAEAIFAAAVAAAQPAAAVRRALRERPPGGGPVALFALGKAARSMAAGAVAQLGAARIRSGVLITPVPGPKLHPSLLAAAGDHPVPGHGSRRAADTVGAAVESVRPGDTAVVLISGGTSSLVGAPAAGMEAGEHEARVRRLLGSGLEIAAMNAERRRISRWGGGRLAQALAARGVAAIRVLLLSDVVDDDPAVIGSGPCVPDDPRDPVLALVTHEVVAGSRTALEGAARRARGLGYAVTLDGRPLTGEAARAGTVLAERLLAEHRGGECLLLGGETTVALGAGPAGTGGRAQELALAAARVLASRSAPSAVLLAAGTDGRDGPTDAAGAVATPATWSAIAAAGIDPAAALARHDAYPALDRAGALLRTGHTGTNVMDVVVGLVGR